MTPGHGSTSCRICSASSPPGDVLPARTIEIARSLAHWVVENAEAGARVPQVARADAADREHRHRRCSDDAPTPARCADAARAGARRRTTSACCPMPAVPASPIPARSLVQRRIAAGIRVVPLVGPSSLLLALMASGMNGQGFAFHGYLPVKPRRARRGAARARSSDRAAHRHAQLFIETPYRNARDARRRSSTTLRAGDAAVRRGRPHAADGDDRASQSMRDWRGADGARYAKRPAIFVLQAGRRRRALPRQLGLAASPGCSS